MNVIAGIFFCRFFDDLRPYAVVQFVPCIAIPVMAILLPPMYTHSTYWLWAAGLCFSTSGLLIFFLLLKISYNFGCADYDCKFLHAGFYLLAKVEEAADKVIYKWTYHIVSGHTLKHLCAAMVPVFLILMLAKRNVETERYFVVFCPSAAFCY